MSVYKKKSPVNSQDLGRPLPSLGSSLGAHLILELPRFSVEVDEQIFSVEEALQQQEELGHPSGPNRSQIACGQ